MWSPYPYSMSSVLYVGLQFSILVGCVVTISLFNKQCIVCGSPVQYSCWLYGHHILIQQAVYCMWIWSSVFLLAVWSPYPYSMSSVLYVDLQFSILVGCVVTISLFNEQCIVCGSTVQYSCWLCGHHILIQRAVYCM